MLPIVSDRASIVRRAEVERLPVAAMRCGGCDREGSTGVPLGPCMTGQPFQYAGNPLRRCSSLVKISRLSRKLANAEECSPNSQAMMPRSASERAAPHRSPALLERKERALVQCSCTRKISLLPGYVALLVERPRRPTIVAEFLKNLMASSLPCEHGCGHPRTSRYLRDCADNARSPPGRRSFARRSDSSQYCSAR